MQGELPDELEKLVRRLRHLSPGAWARHRQQVHEVLCALAELGDSIEPRQVPELPDHAMADAVAVIGGDAVDAAQRSADPQRVAAVGEALRRGLAATR